MSTCLELLQDEIDRYHVVVSVSLVLTVGMMIVRRNQRVRSPKVFYGMGAVKMLLAALMCTVFYPSCPEGCSCTQPFYIYPIFVAFIGVFWIFDGYRLQSGNDDHGEYA